MISWETAIKPLLGGPIASPPSGFTADDLEAIVRALNAHAEKILDHESTYECFFSSYVALAGHYIANCFDKVPRHLFQQFTKACELIMEFCLTRLQNFDVQCAVPQKNLMQLISALTLGNSPFVRVDVITFTAMIKSAEVPMIVRKSEVASEPKSEEPKKSEPSDFIAQMSQTFALHSSGIPFSSTGKEISRDALLKENISVLAKLAKKQSFDKIYRNLSYLKRYMNRLDDVMQGRKITLPDSTGAAATIRNGLGPLSSNISIVLQAVSLPLMDPLTVEKVENLSKLGLSCMYAGLSVAAAMTYQITGKQGAGATSSSVTVASTGKSKEPDYHSIADGILLEVFQIYAQIEEIFEAHPLHVLQNFRMMAAYIVSQGLDVILKQQSISKGDDAKHSGKDSKINLFILALARSLTDILEKMLEKLDYQMAESESFQFSSSMLDINALNATDSRILVIFEKCNVIKMLVDFVYSCFEDSENNAKKDHASSKGVDSGASDDSNLDEKVYDDENTDDEYLSSGEDQPNGSFGFAGGPILGEWFLQELNAENNEQNASDLARPPLTFELSEDGARRKFILPGEAFISKESDHLQSANASELVTRILNILNYKFFSTKSKTIKGHMLENLELESIVKLASLVTRTKQTEENSRALMSLLHNLLSSDLIHDEAESAVLSALGVDTPSKQLFANPKSLSVLFKILFRHQMLEKQDGKDDKRTIDFVQAVVEHFSLLESSKNVGNKAEYIDVTVVQMCLFFFHTLTDGGKGNFFNSVIYALASCNEAEKIPRSTPRLLLLLEYLLHHYTQPAGHLFSDTQRNLITLHLETDAGDADLESGATYESLRNFTLFSFNGESADGQSEGQERTILQPTGDEECELQVHEEFFYEVSDSYLAKGELEVDPAALELIKKFDIDIANLRDIVISALNAGSKFKLVKSSHEPQALWEKSLYMYNFSIGWRLLCRISPLVAQQNENTGSLAAIMAAADVIGKATIDSSENGKNSVEKLVLLLSALMNGNYFEGLVSDTKVLDENMLPSFSEISALNCVLREVLVFSSKEDEKLELPAELFSAVMKALEYFGRVCRSYALANCQEPKSSFEVLDALMQMDVAKLNLVEGAANAGVPAPPSSVLQEIEKWEPASRSKTTSESLSTKDVVQEHLKALNGNDSYLVVLQFVVLSLHEVLAKISPWEELDNKPADLPSHRTLFSLLTDSIMNKFTDTKSLDVTQASEKYRESVRYHIVNRIYNFILNAQCEEERKDRKYSILFLKFLENLLSQKDARSIKIALRQFFIESKMLKKPLTKEDPKSAVPAYSGIDFKYSGEFLTLLMKATSMPKQFAHAFFSFVCAMLDGTVGDNPDPHLLMVVKEMNKLLEVGEEAFNEWLATFTDSLLLRHSTGLPKRSDIPLRLVRYISHPDSPVNHGLALKILEVSLGEVQKHLKTEPVTDFLTIFMTLAEAKNGQGHFKLFKSCLELLEMCREELARRESLGDLSSQHANIVSVCELMLFYVTDVLLVFHNAKPDDTYVLEYDEDDDDIIHDDGAVGSTKNESMHASPVPDYDQDEDEELRNKLCTYTITQKEFMNQHWYHCHTCDMTEGIGVCTICAKVCHRGHDLAYAKNGSFFCDCGAKGSKACRALTKRDRVIENPTRSTSSSTTVVPSAASSTMSVRSKEASAAASSSTSLGYAIRSEEPAAEPMDIGRRQQRTKRMKLCKNLDGCRDELLVYLSSENGREKSIALLLSVASDLEKITCSEEYHSMMPNSTAYAMKMIEKLHTSEKRVETVETLLIPTLGSQEGAFENVKANFTGEQGQAIRQLINSKTIYRVGMSCLSAGSGKRHHLAVSHEKTKLTILQLSALLKQANASKRKLTLTRLSTTQLPFSIVTIANNPCNEEVLAVCGLKDCHVLTFNPAGVVNDHLTLHPQLTAGNYIIKTIWLPGSASQIALITAKFVKIYDLSKDALSPSFYFLLPTGKIRDSTFMTCGKDVTLIIMSSTGYLYIQGLHDCCSAMHGPFYITGTLAVSSESLKEKNDEVGGGGISVYYSHTLQLLFFSYGNGQNFAATLDIGQEEDEVLKLFPVNFKPTNGKASNGGSLALYSWTEVMGHPGLLTCFTHTTGVPLAVMVEPEKIELQEMKTTTAKAKIQDLVAVLHSSPGDVERSTIIGLCEDGSLRIYLASQDATGFWLNPSLQPRSVFSRHNGEHHSARALVSSSAENAKAKDDQIEPIFPVDFFEDCQLIGPNDLEFGGDSLLQVYNPVQIRNRLANQDMYVVSKRTFVIEIMIKNRNLVVTGIRMQVGQRGSDFAPTHIYIGDRYLCLGPRLKKARWFDFPLTREESIRFQHKLVVTCGLSVHPDDYNIVDSIKVYGKTKENFGWQEEALEKSKQTPAKSEEKSTTASKEEPSGTSYFIQSSDPSQHASPTDRLLLACLACLNCAFAKEAESTDVSQQLKSQMLDLSSRLLIRALPHAIHSQVKQLMMNVLTDGDEYHKFKDTTMLNHISETLASHKPQEELLKSSDELSKCDSTCGGARMQPDEYQSLLMELSRIAVRRPRNLLSIKINMQWPPRSAEPVTAKPIPESLKCNCIDMEELLGILIRMIEEKPSHRLLTPPCLPGIQNVESSVQAFVDVVHSTAMTVAGAINAAAYIYYDLLTSEQVRVSSAARSALIRLLYYPSVAAVPTINKPKSRSGRSNSKSTDSGPSTRSNSPLTVMSGQPAGASGQSNGGGVITIDPNHHMQEWGARDDAMRPEVHDDNEDEDDDNEDDEETDGDEFDDDDDEEGVLEEMLMEERGNGIAPSLHRDEQLRAMQALEENMNNDGQTGNGQVGNDASGAVVQSPRDNGAASQIQRLQEYMQASDNQNYFMQEDSSLEELIMDVPDEEFAEFGGDDEAMVEFAIALSLQQSNGGGSGQQDAQPASFSDGSNALPGQGLEQLVRDISSGTPETVSPQTENPPESAALDETYEISDPQEAEEICSGAAAQDATEDGRKDEPTSDDKIAADGPSSAEVALPTISAGRKHRSSSVFNEDKIVGMRISLLQELLWRLPMILELDSGERSIPYFQVLIALTKLLDPTKEAQKKILVRVVTELAKNVSGTEHVETIEVISERSALKEVLCNIVRCLVILMCMHGYANSAKDEVESTTKSETISSVTAKILVEHHVIEFCISQLDKMLEQHWNVGLAGGKAEGAVLTRLLEPAHDAPTPDYSPIILPQYVRAHASDVFEMYAVMVTERLLHLPYRFKKFYDSEKIPLPDHLTHHFEAIPPSEANLCWILSDYMLSTDIPVVKKRVRKALLYFCGTKENYREARDVHALSRYIENISETWSSADVLSKSGAVNFPYDQLISIVTYLEACLTVATKRTANWQKSCLGVNAGCMEFLLQLSIYITEDVAASVLQLLTCAVSPEKEKDVSGTAKKEKKSSKHLSKVLCSGKTRLAPEHSNRPSGNTEMALQLSGEFLEAIDEVDLRAFLLRFLLEVNTASVRWDAHQFVQQLFWNSKPELQTKLVNSLWNLWPVVPGFGRKAIQFVDLLGFLSIKNGLFREKSQLCSDATFGMLKRQNTLLTDHPNSMLYMQLSNYVDFDGYFLESNPCLICNQPEVPFQNIKLASVKADTKYTTTQHIIKLVGGYSLQKATIKITDIKQTKMIRTASLLYNNKKVPAIIELKNKPELWHKAKQVVLTQRQNEVKFDLPLPVVATNLMLEFSDFYENVSATTETLQCPRCSASVQSNPGICGNCGENVFQCHKCRSINYDEKDPFLCNVCGFSKYAKFDVTLLAKPCCAVETIDNEEDRKKTVGLVSGLLEKANHAYYQMLTYKPQLEQILLQVEKLSTGPVQNAPKQLAAAGSSTSQASGSIPGNSRIPIMSTTPPISIASGGGVVNTSLGSSVNAHIRQLAQKYCVEAKTSFSELSKIMKTVLASRKEIVEYDQRQRIALGGGQDFTADSKQHPSATVTSSSSAKHCYGCAAATAKQCIVLLRALASDAPSRKRLVQKGLIAELVHVSLRRGNAATRKQVQDLISQLVKNDHEASAELNGILLTRITSGMVHYNQDLFPAAVCSEMNLLVAILGIQDQCWQSRLRTVVKLFQLSVKMHSPAVVENITLPCLQMLQNKAAPAVSASVTSKLIEAAKRSKGVTVNVQAWLVGDKNHDFSTWREDKIKSNAVSQTGADELAKATQADAHEEYLVEKYARRWLSFLTRRKAERADERKAAPSLPQNRWFRQMLFCKSSRAVRQAACAIVKSLAENTSRKAQVIDMLTSYLDELSTAGEAAAEFFVMYQEQIRDPHWKIHLAGRDILPFIGNLIEKEISDLLKLEESTLSLDLQQGYSLKELTVLLCQLVHVPYIRQHYKSRLVGTVLNGYLSLRKLVIQRTTIIDDTQELLLELLEDMTTGTELETKAFMSVCIETINKYGLSDIRTPQFIFERLANIIFPEESNTNEFFMSLDKDPLQEDFLQGRMVGNPYSSNKPDLGPLMRDVKNKICRDCDLVALLEDDSGMELLVNNKIISLDLPVRDVYNKVWLPSRGEDEAMRVVYRMRGLLGEATEDIITKLDPEVDDRDEEEVYKMSGVLSECGGIEAMLQRLESVQNLTHARQLVDSILKLIAYAVRLKSNRKYFMRPELNTLNVLLGTLNMALQSGEKGVPLVEQLLGVMDRILQETADDKTQIFTGDKEKLTLLLEQIDSELVRRHSKVLRGLMKIVPFLSFGDPDLMQMLIDHFKSALDFEKFDENRTDEDAVYLDCFCEISTGIEDNENGDKLKELIVKNSIVNNALAYLSRYIPQHKNFESEDWKAFVARPALPYCLRLLAGLSAKHATTQTLIGQTSIPDLHRLEQVSTEGSIGSLAENVLEAICEHANVAKNVKEIRRETRAEKKRLAMAMRQKELGALGMKTNAKGQVVTQTTLLKQIGDLVEESGLTCIICREGYKFEPKKVLGIYTYSRRCALEPFEKSARKQQGYSTVSHFNVVHYDCHTSAVRAARGREEWESAMLQNANTKCNGLLPHWGPHVPESAFATCLARHNSYLQEATGFKEPNVTSTVHDLKLLLLRFAHERSFSEETGGGGPQSNIHLIPYIIHMAQYVINTTRSASREEHAVAAFLGEPKEAWVESSYAVAGPLYSTALTVFVCDRAKWMANRVMYLRRLMVLCQTRQSSASPIAKLTDREIKAFETYKPFLLFWAMADLIYNELLKEAPEGEKEDSWARTLQVYIRTSDTALQDTSEKTMKKFQQEYQPIASLDEFVDVAGLHDEIGGTMNEFLRETFDSLPK